MKSTISVTINERACWVWTCLGSLQTSFPSFWERPGAAQGSTGLIEVHKVHSTKMRARYERGVCHVGTGGGCWRGGSSGGGVDMEHSRGSRMRSPVRKGSEGGVRGGASRPPLRTALPSGLGGQGALGGIQHHGSRDVRCFQLRGTVCWPPSTPHLLPLREIVSITSPDGCYLPGPRRLVRGILRFADVNLPHHPTCLTKYQICPAYFRPYVPSSGTSYTALVRCSDTSPLLRPSC